MPHFLIAPDSFKGTLSSAEVCDIIAEAILSRIPDAKITKLPVADGGEGMAAALMSSVGGDWVGAEVTGVFGEPMQAEYALLSNGFAAIDMSACAGLPLAGSKKNPALTTTQGVGELILHALGRGVKNIILGLGGSATNDCGIGMAHAFGYRFFDSDNNEPKPVGGNMSTFVKIKKPDTFPKFHLTAACDVDNPLYGPQGAAYVFAPQKGADETMVKDLDAGLRNMAKLIKNDLGTDVADLPGAGAAGGMGAGVVAFLAGELRSGIDLVLDAANYDEKLEEADYVITGEGRMDAQSLHGKVPAGVAKRAYEKGKKVIAINGSLGEGAQEMMKVGISSIYAAVEAPKSMEEIIKTCREDLFNVTLKAVDELR
ncbi:MAG TPA: glycerate kinase [Clostridiales bacterium]|nr:glycerate kinase [Clostridiales bacterium]